MSDYRAIPCDFCLGDGWNVVPTNPCIHCNGTGKVIVTDPKPGVFDNWRDALKFVGVVFVAGAFVLGILLGWLLFIRG